MSNVIVNEIGKVVASMRTVAADPNAPGAGAPYYMYGHRQNISNRLLAKNNQLVYQYQKYPVIALRMDFPERVKGNVLALSLNIVIATFTNKNYTEEQRYANVMEPVLYPLYEKFMDKLAISGAFMWPGMPDRPEHVKIDRLFWGVTAPEANKGYIFNDPLDAIEIMDLKINYRTNKC